MFIMYLNGMSDILSATQNILRLKKLSTISNYMISLFNKYSNPVR